MMRAIMAGLLLCASGVAQCGGGEVHYDDSSGEFTFTVNWDCPECTVVLGWLDIDQDGEPDAGELLDYNFTLTRQPDGSFKGLGSFVQPGLGSILLGVPYLDVCFGCLNPLGQCPICCTSLPLYVDP